MIIYNITTKVDHAISNEWLSWIETKLNPAIIATGCFTHAVILRLLEVDETEGPTFAVQYHATSKSLYNQYVQKYATNFRNEALNKWNDQILSFNSVLEVVG